MKEHFDLDDDGWMTYIGPDPVSAEHAWEISLVKWDLLAHDKKFAHVVDGGLQTCGLCMMDKIRQDGVKSIDSTYLANVIDEIYGEF